MEKVSVVLPTYNRAGTIMRSVESVLAQTYAEFEMLVIDDGSADNTEEILSAVKDERIRYIRQENRGVAAARNEGIRQAKYDYVAFQDSDDFWKPDKLEKQMRLFRERPDAGLVYCAYEGTKADGTSVIVPDDLEREPLYGNLYRQLLIGNTIGGPTAVIRKACFAKCGLFDESLTCLEDWELFLRIAKEYEIGFVRESLVIADIHEGGVSSKVGGYFHTRCAMIAMHKENLLAYGIFNQVVEQVFVMAKQAGVFEQVAKMLAYSLGN